MRMLLLLVGLLLPACTTPAPLNIPQQTAAQTLEVSGHTRTEVLEAIQQVFTWADPDDTTVALTAGGLTATRTLMTSSLIPLGMREEWIFTLDSPAAPSTVFVETRMTIAGRQYVPHHPEFYRLALARVAYALHDQPTWETCKEFEARTGLRQPFFRPHSHHQFLCLDADDQVPRALWARYGLPEPDTAP